MKISDLESQTGGESMKKLKAWQVESLRKFLDRQEANAIEMSASKEPLGAYYTGKADAYGVIAEMIKTMLGGDDDGE